MIQVQMIHFRNQLLARNKKEEEHIKRYSKTTFKQFS